MNTYKKTIMALVMTFITTHAYGLTANEIKGVIANEIVQPIQKLSVNNIFDQAIPTPVFKNLAATATSIEEFIKTTGKSDADLMKAVEHAKNAKNVLINGMIQCYQKLNAGDLQGANAILSDFTTIEKNMTNIKNAIDNITFFVPGKKEARELLATFAELLIFIAKKAQIGVVNKLPGPPAQ